MGRQSPRHKRTLTEQLLTVNYRIRSSQHSPVHERRPVAIGSALGGHPRVGGEMGLSSFELAE